MEFFAEGYAKGICEGGAAGSEIEVFTDEMNFIINTIVEDAVQYRRYDSEGEVSEEEDDIELADRYVETADRLRALVREIKAYEEENNPGELTIRDPDEVDEQEIPEEKAVVGPLMRGVIEKQLRAMKPNATMTLEDDREVVRDGDSDGWTLWEDGEHYHYSNIDNLLDEIL